MILVIFGPPGAGKGTQSRLIADELKVLHISTGDILRDAIGRQTELGKKASDYMDAGELVPDDLVSSMIFERIKEPDADAGFILDGYPRNVKQAIELDRMLELLSKKVDLVVNVVISDEEIIRRLSGRRVCDLCGRVTHVEYDPQANLDVCDVCGGDLKTRMDDTPEAIKNRLKVYYNQTLPVLDYYRAKGIVKDANGWGEKDNIFSEIIGLIKKK
ncbi:MAG: adenylate kinase [Actinobacteria bacterium]|nr:adenylate kinase [Bacillota bacterium]MCL5985332.1 adenylate kinase [Actinomycetota bacterium]